MALKAGEKIKPKRVFN